MKYAAFVVVLALFFTLPATAMDEITSNEGSWPKAWPTELEPLRKQAISGLGGLVSYPFHEIKFTNRDTFESAWPHILKLKTAGAELTLLNGKNTGARIRIGSQFDSFRYLPVLSMTLS